MTREQKEAQRAHGRIRDCTEPAMSLLLDRLVGRDNWRLRDWQPLKSQAPPSSTLVYQLDLKYGDEAYALEVEAVKAPEATSGCGLVTIRLKDGDELVDVGYARTISPLGRWAFPASALGRGLVRHLGLGRAYGDQLIQEGLPLGKLRERLHEAVVQAQPTPWLKDPGAVEAMLTASLKAAEETRFSAEGRPRLSGLAERARMPAAERTPGAELDR